MDAPTPRLAAVTILHREGPVGVEVYWVRRADTLAFLGGFWAFPGGRMEPTDPSLRHAAARELAEEAGVVVPPDAFEEAGRTLTPTWANIRFDCTYYVVPVPVGQEPLVTPGELVLGEWVRPVDALAAWSRGERLTSPVVVRALEAFREGAAGVADRMRHAMASDTLISRMWDLAPGLAMASLRSPTVPPATHTNCFVVGTGARIVIDPGSPYPDEQEALDAAITGLEVAEIWITHHHPDHIGGVRHLAERTGARIAAHEDTARRIAGEVKVDRLLRDGEVITLPGEPERRLRVVFTPGHTPGHHSYLEETTGYVCAGDMVAGVGTIVIDPDEGDMRDYLASLSRLASLGSRALLPAHGPIMTDPRRRLDEYARHRLWRETRVVEALDGRPATLAELLPRVYEDVPPAAHLLASRSLLAHLLKLIRDGRVVDEAGTYRLTRS